MTNEPPPPPNLSDLARLMGRKGGSAKSPRKTAANRENGKRNAERIRALRSQQASPDLTQPTKP